MFCLPYALGALILGVAGLATTGKPRRCSNVALSVAELLGLPGFTRNSRKKVAYFNNVAQCTKNFNFEQKSGTLTLSRTINKFFLFRHGIIPAFPSSADKYLRMAVMPRTTERELAAIAIVRELIFNGSLHAQWHLQRCQALAKRKVNSWNSPCITVAPMRKPCSISVNTGQKGDIMVELVKVRVCSARYPAAV